MEIFNPVSTYRIDFQKKFPLQQFKHVMDYLGKLGIQTVYASPIFKSVPGTAHGYDVLCPTEINAEIGSFDELKEIIGELKQRKIHWLQDIVPNHMAFHPGNDWLMDVLENGKRSRYASFFDIDWQNGIDPGKLMIPVLDASLENCIKDHKIELAFRDKIVLKYHDGLYPVNAKGCGIILKAIMNDELGELRSQCQHINDTKKSAVHCSLPGHLLEKFKENNRRNEIEGVLDELSRNEEVLRQVTQEQFYVLCEWKQAEKKINYRRFFTINSMICLNMQNKNVFDHYHALIKKCVAEGMFEGLRVDHIDGLYSPSTYLQQLKQFADKPLYVAVEKILEPGESLSRHWQTEGTTGYDFLSLVNNLFTNRKNKKLFHDFYQEITNTTQTEKEQLYQKKAFVLSHHMMGELENLCRLLMQTVDRNLLSGVRRADLKAAIGEFLVHCPVYRYYGEEFPLARKEASAVARVFLNIRKEGRTDERAISILEKIFLNLPGNANKTSNKKNHHFYKRCMQFTGPLMAKGLEDTLMYTYNNFIAHNEVGDSPGNFGITTDEFHQAMTERQKKWPLTMNTTSTHDTKRGEDVRARLNVVSDLPDQWFQHVKEWREMNRLFKEKNIPSDNEEYFIYQNLIGAYPMPGTPEGNFKKRFAEYLQKALREAKANSNWASPNQQYEATTERFMSKMLNKKNPFWKSFKSFHQLVADFGMINSLSQLLLKFTCPGVPDVYRGCELWDLSFVDPDNRRPVNYRTRMETLRSLNEQASKKKFLDLLWQNRENGGIKIWLTQTLFRLRKLNPDFFVYADYTPLRSGGTYSDFVLAFARKHNDVLLIVVIPLHAAALCDEQRTKDFFSVNWKDTHILLPKGSTKEARSMFIDSTTTLLHKQNVQPLFTQLPFCLLSINYSND